MKLIKKQPSTSYVTQATASKSLYEQAVQRDGGFTQGDVANHGDFIRLPSRSMAVTSSHKVGFIAQVSFAPPLGKGYGTAIPGVHSSHTPKGLEKHSQLRKRHPSCNVEEGAHNRSNGNTAYLLRK